ncbi:outer membrane biosynthesis protein TonB [Conyzicola lurida]|uniref:Outer membrane biosynthesis protein TonB n=1 Tax=Conyzicola lurida TaxID=1172621 RepID=A0A841AT72_9MICO|nr:hypothetical protein [Conyzicola lurida]MBB5845142.1 outer membrane biosynthesis protein TonB [Conyzicola lurida]
MDRRHRITLVALGAATVACALVAANLPQPTSETSAGAPVVAAPSASPRSTEAPAPGPTAPPLDVQPATPVPPSNGEIPDAAADPAPAPAPAPTVAPAPAPAPAPAVPRTTTEVEHLPTDPVVMPADPPPAPLATLPPEAVSAAKALVPGFPDSLTLLAGSTVVSSSLDSDGPVVHATVDATTTESPQSVVEYFQSAFAKLDLAGSPLPAAGSDTGMVFARADSSVTLTVSPTAAGAAYSLFAVLTVAQ